MLAATFHAMLISYICPLFGMCKEVLCMKVGGKKCIKGDRQMVVCTILFAMTSLYILATFLFSVRVTGVKK